VSQRYRHDNIVEVVVLTLHHPASPSRRPLPRGRRGR
jgi:hypothetical protein